MNWEKSNAVILVAVFKKEKRTGMEWNRIVEARQSLPGITDNDYDQPYDLHYSDHPQLYILLQMLDSLQKIAISQPGRRKVNTRHRFGNVIFTSQVKGYQGRQGRS